VGGSDQTAVAMGDGKPVVSSVGILGPNGVAADLDREPIGGNRAALEPYVLVRKTR